MQTAKQQAESVLRRLPDNCTLEDIRYHLYVLEKIGKGRKDIEEGRSFTADEARERLPLPGLRHRRLSAQGDDLPLVHQHERAGGEQALAAAMLATHGSVRQGDELGILIEDRGNALAGGQVQISRYAVVLQL